MNEHLGGTKYRHVSKGKLFVSTDIHLSRIDLIDKYLPSISVDITLIIKIAKIRTFFPTYSMFTNVYSNVGVSGFQKSNKT